MSVTPTEVAITGATHHILLGHLKVYAIIISKGASDEMKDCYVNMKNIWRQASVPEINKKLLMMIPITWITICIAHV